ncbi:MAG: hypothetical protein V1813_03450, partial [Candidatus Aenigmatarchaeota archaeon]
LFAIGIGSYFGESHTEHFSLGDISAGWAISNAGMLLQHGVEEQFFVFSHNYSDGVSIENDLGYYVRTMLIWISPLILILFLISFKHFWRDDGKLLMISWFLVFFIFATFLITLKGARLLLPALPAITVLAGKGFMDISGRIKQRNVVAIVLCIIALTGIYGSLNTVATLHDCYRKTGEFINSEIKQDDLIFYTGMPQLLFYHEIETGNWWEAGDMNSTGRITYVILEAHKYTNKYMDVARFERDFKPVKVIINDDTREENGIPLGIPDYNEIRIYKPGRDISGYFSKQ